jgi:heptosyltransferase I
MAAIATHPGLTGLSPGRVCLIKPSALGDVVNAFAALGCLRRLWPAAEITWVINSGLRGLVEGHPWVDRVIVYDRQRTRLGPAGIATLGRFLRDLRRPRFDLAVDLQGLLRSGVMTAATRAPVRVGLADAREGATWFYTHRVRPPGTIDEAHAVDRLLAVAAAFGADVARPTFAVAVGADDRTWARRVLSDVARPRLALNLGARWVTKRWPPGHFAELARRAVSARGAGLFAVGAPDDRPLVDDLARRLEPAHLVNLCGGTTLPRLAALFEQSDVVLSNDSGPLHLAVAAGARVVGVYTCTSPALNGPYGPSALAAESRVWCKASYRVTCPRLECMAELTPDRVWPLVLAQLDAASRGRRV